LSKAKLPCATGRNANANQPFLLEMARFIDPVTLTLGFW